MSLLGDFAGNFLSIAGNNMQQQEDQDRAIRLQEEIERRRTARMQNLKAKTSLPEVRAVGAPYQDPQSGRWMQRTQQAQQATMDERTGDVTRPASWMDGEAVEVADPNALTPYQRAQIDQKELDRQNRMDVAAVRSSGKGGRGGSAIPRDADGMSPKERAAEDRAKRKDERDIRAQALQEADSEVAPFLKQIDGLSATEEAGVPGVTQLSMFMAQQGAGRAEQTNPAQAKAWLLKKAREEKLKEYGIGGGGKPGTSRDNPASATDFDGEPPSGTWVKLPSGKVMQVP